MSTSAILSGLADRSGACKTQWLRVQELAHQWRESGEQHFKAEAAELLVKLMAADALIKIKAMRVDAKLPARLRRDYEAMATSVVSSVLANPNTRATAILENHDPEKALMRTMVNFYLHNKIVDHLRDQPVEGIFRTVARTAKLKPGGPAADTAGAATNADVSAYATLGEAKDDTTGQLPDATQLSAEPQETPHAPRYQPSSMLADNAPGAAPLPEPDSAWDTEHEFLSDLTKLLTAQEQEAAWYDIAGYTADEAASAIGISESTFKRRLGTARAKFSAYHALDE